MGFLDRVFGGVRPAPVHTRALDSFEDHPGLTEQLLRVQGITPRPWLAPSIREALGVPAIFRAVSLLANTAGSLSLVAWRNGELMTTPPALVRRPDPFTTPREFVRATVWSLATRGEAFWYVTRDRGVPVSVVPVNGAEVRVEWDSRGMERIYFWRNRRMAPGQLRHITFQRETGSARGVGPLQLCGAAISAAIESTEWAANFFAEGGVPSVNLHSGMELDDADADALRDRWLEERAGTVRVTSGDLELRDVQISPQRAQLLEARTASVGDVARMYGVPAHLLMHAQPGSSLTYQNLGDVATEFVRFSLAPGYLEPIEQELGELLPADIVTRFDVEGLQRADIKTRFEVYESAIAVFGEDDGRRYARRHEGLIPGDSETRPVPPAPDNATPVAVPRPEGG